MAYSEYQQERIARIFKDKGLAVEGRKMMGGYLFMLDEKMCVGIHTDKKSKEEVLMARIGPDAMEEAHKKLASREMDFTGRPMKGFIFVDAEGFDFEEDLEYWIQLAIDFNPLAQKSKKKKKKVVNKS